MVGERPDTGSPQNETKPPNEREGTKNVLPKTQVKEARKRRLGEAKLLIKNLPPKPRLVKEWKDQSKIFSASKRGNIEGRYFRKDTF